MRAWISAFESFLAVLRDAEVLGEGGELGLVVRQELVQGRVEEADRHFLAGHDLEEAVEVVALHRLELVEGLDPLLLGVGEDHLADHVDALLVEEHVLGAARALCPRPRRAGRGRRRAACRRWRAHGSAASASWPGR